jgi:Putative transposase/Transposase zinc-binding domain
MPPPALRLRLELADILRAHGQAYRARHPVSPEQAKVMTSLVQCRTAILGGHVDSCNGCGFVRISYNSCRDRHCPKCQASERAAWIDARLERLLPVEYFHVVFTLPDQLQPLILKNRRVLYTLLFRAATETLLALAADPKRLGAQIGVTAVLHTWGQNLLFHPHLHCVVTGGGLSPDGCRWVATRDGYFLPVQVLSRLFRGKFLAQLRRLHQTGQLTLTGSVAALVQAHAFQQLLDRLYRKKWVVYAKPPFGGAEQVYRYLGRYTHRVAISNSRLISMREGRVQFHYKDYADGQKSKRMSLSADEFLRRFLLHVLPKGFVRIRHYGLLASPNVKTKLKRCQWLLGPADSVRTESVRLRNDPFREWIENVITRCPRCGGHLTTTSFDRGTTPSAGRVACSHLRPAPTIMDSS